MAAGWQHPGSEFKPEIYSGGHRNTPALIIHPVTSELWNSENGPNGGDEINIVKAGKNYGWPTVRPRILN